jgi:hypothetical protein
MSSSVQVISNFDPISKPSLLKGFAIKTQLEWVHPRMIKQIGYNYGIDPRVPTEDAIDQLSELFKQKFYQRSERVSAFNEYEYDGEEEGKQISIEGNRFSTERISKVQFSTECKMRVYHPASGSILEDTVIQLDTPIRRRSLFNRLFSFFQLK